LIPSRSGVVFLDRDGVINSLVTRDDGLYSPQRLEDFHIFPSSALLVQGIKALGFQVVVVTNQPDISRGLLSMDALNEMHGILRDIGIDDVLVCPHSDRDRCNCRKPRPGLLTAYLVERKPTEAWMVGDRKVDIAAGNSAGCRTILYVHRESPVPSNFNESLLSADFTTRDHAGIISIITNANLGV